MFTVLVEPIIFRENSLRLEDLLCIYGQVSNQVIVREVSLFAYCVPSLFLVCHRLLLSVTIICKSLANISFEIPVNFNLVFNWKEDFELGQFD